MKKSTAIIITGSCSLVLYVFLIYVDGFEMIVEWSRQYEKYEIDELLLVLPVYAFALSIFVLIEQKQLKKTNQDLQHEIAQRKLIENKLKDSEYMLANHLNSTPVAVIFWDFKFKITLWNPAAEKIYGYKKSEVIGKNLIGLLFQETYHDSGDKIIHDLTKNDNSVQRIIVNINNKGEPLPCHWSNTLLRNRYERAVGVASLINRINDNQTA